MADESNQKLWFEPYFDSDRPWLDRDRLADKPDGATFAIERADGTIDSYSTVGEANQELAADAKGTIRGVSLPNFKKLVPPALLRRPVATDDARIRQAFLGDVRKALLYSAFIAVLLYAEIPGLRLGPGEKMLAIILLFLFGIAPLINSSCQWLDYAKKRTPEERERKRAEEILFSGWVQDFARWPIVVGIGFLVVMFLVQAFHQGGLSSFQEYSRSLGHSFREVGLMRQKVRMGDEWWRIVTAGLLHGGMIHLYFNSNALYSIGSVLVGVCRMSWVIIVFTLSVVGGSLASIYGPIRFGASVGASGGIMGLLGFLLVLSFFYKGGFPHFIKGAILRSVVLIAILGWFGSQFIDNAAHAGGFAVGAAIGLIAVPFGDIMFGKQKTPIYIYPVAGVCAVVLLYGAVKICRILLEM